MVILLRCITLVLFIIAVCVYLSIYVSITNEKNIINKIFYFEVFSQKAFLEKIENKNLKTQIKKRLNLFYLLLISTMVLEVISIFTRSFL